MYLTLSQPLFRQALSAVNHVTTHLSGVLPILSQVLLAATPGCLEITASNGEQGIRYRIPADVEAPGRALLPARLLTDLVRDLPDAPLRLAVPAPTDATAAQIRCGQARATITLTALAIDEFPRVPEALAEDTDELLALDGALLQEMVGQVCFAAATDLSRPALTGVRLTMADGQATIAAADAFRLATRTFPVPDQERQGAWLIPARALIELARLLSPEGGVSLLLTEQGHQILFHTRNLDFSSPLLSGTYPDIRRVIPTQFVTRATISTRELVSALKMMRAFGQEQVQISLSNGTEGAELTLQVTAPDLGSTHTRLPLTIQGPDQSLCLSLSYLAEALAAIPTPEVLLHLVNARTPIVLTPLNELAAMHVIMPLVKAPQAAPTPPTPAQPSSGAAR